MRDRTNQATRPKTVARRAAPGLPVAALPVAALPVAALAVATLAAALSAGPAAAQEATLKAVTFLPANTSFVAPVFALVDRIEAEDAGVTLAVAGGPELVPPFEQANAARLGAVDVAVVPVNYYRGLLIEAEVLQLSGGSFADVRDSGAWDYLAGLHRQQAGLHLLTAYGDVVPFHTYLRRPVEAEDFSGLRLRVTPVYQAFYEELGADTVTIAPTEVYVALERGVVDGLGWPIWDVNTFGWDDFVDWRVDPGFYNTAIAVLVNAERWDGLTAGQQAALDRAARAFEADISEAMAARSADELARQDAAGIRAIDLGPGHAARAEAVYWRYLMEQRPETVGRLAAMMGHAPD